jgi:hypothetical protein
MHMLNIAPEVLSSYSQNYVKLNVTTSTQTTFQEIKQKKKIFFNLHSEGWNQGPLDTAATCVSPG